MKMMIAIRVDKPGILYLLYFISTNSSFLSWKQRDIGYNY